MQALSPLPAKSQIRLKEHAGVVTLQWSAPRELSPGHILFVPFMALWLTGWAAGELLVLGSLVFGSTGSNTFLTIVWLVAWTLGGIEASMRFVGAVRGPAPERIVLAKEHLRHVPSVTWNWEWLFRRLRGNQSGTDISKHQLASLRLQHTRPQRLLYGYGPNQIEIGRDLENSDREWLADAVSVWASRDGYR